MVIIDPDYTGKTGAVRRVKDLKGLGLFRQLFRFITGGSGERVSGETCCRRAISEIVQNGCPMEWFNDWEVIRK